MYFVLPEPGAYKRPVSLTTYTVQRLLPVLCVLLPSPIYYWPRQTEMAMHDNNLQTSLLLKPAVKRSRIATLAFLSIRRLSSRFITPRPTSVVTLKRDPWPHISVCAL